ncbi:MAG TPA: lytic murein transglycosylase [Burkholderiaceae bacterium]
MLEPHTIRARCAGIVRTALAIGVLAGCATASPELTAPQPAQPLPPTAATPEGSAGGTAAAAAPAAAAASAPAPAGATPALEQRFADWVATFRASAAAQGIDEATLDATLGSVSYLPRVVELDRAQPEFTRAVWDYLDTLVSPQRVTRGLDKLQQVRTQADDAAARYGVPAATLVAIWGVESNFGDNYGSTPTIDALATLGFDGRREAWARNQLVAALKIVQSGDIARAQMIGSWAGAMGQTQFLPTNYLAYAVDGDGDGRRDIWGSTADVMSSTAHFLQRVGWQPGQPWGLEVQLPAGFDLGRADAQTRQSSAQWAAEGVSSLNGAPLPALDDSAIVLPAGARGPAFLVGPNFRAVLRYNNSVNYALAVNLLAQRIAGGPGVQAAWPRELQPLTRTQSSELQSALNARGFDAGAADGVIGPATRDALRRFQRSVGQAADGYPTLELLQRLQAP